MRPQRAPWNHNIHYHALILGAVPVGCQRGLDVGCGEGGLARKLRQVVPHVVGIDSDAPVIDRARQQDKGAGVEYINGDFLAYDLQPESFDVIVSVAALHHMNEPAALSRMRELLRPFGTLAVVGLARSRLRDLPADAAGVVAHRALLVGRKYQQVNAPTIWPPPQTYAQVRRDEPSYHSFRADKPDKARAEPCVRNEKTLDAGAGEGGGGRAGPVRARRSRGPRSGC